MVEFPCEIIGLVLFLFFLLLLFTFGLSAITLLHFQVVLHNHHDYYFFENLLSVVIYRNYIFGLHPQLVKVLQSHKGEMSVFLLLKVTFGPH